MIVQEVNCAHMCRCILVFKTFKLLKGSVFCDIEEKNIATNMGKPIRLI